MQTIGLQGVEQHHFRILTLRGHFEIAGLFNFNVEAFREVISPFQGIEDYPHTVACGFFPFPEFHGSGNT